MPVQPTLLIGLGTSGMKVLNEIEKLMYATFSTNSQPNTQAMYIETDTRAHPVPTPAGTAMTQTTISVDNLDNAIERLQANAGLDIDWVSSELPKQMKYNAQGAGGVRPAGRLLLWNPANFGSVYTAISKAWQDVNRGTSAVADGNQRVQDDGLHRYVYVIGSLVGGTCSGTFIDIGYILRKITASGQIGITQPSRVSITGVFLVPIENAPKLEVGCANTYGALLELEEFRRVGHPFNEQWPNGVFCGTTSDLPFDHVHLISAEYGDGSGAMDLDTCYSVAGMKLFCDIVGLSSNVGRVIVDGSARGNYTFFSTFGISAVMYPRYALSEAAACELGIRLCDRWLDEETLRNSDGTVRGGIREKDIYEEACGFLNKYLEDAFNQLESRAQGLPMRVEVDREIRRVLDGELTIDKFAESLLTGNSTNYLGVIRDNSRRAAQTLADSITSCVRTAMTDKQNLKYAELLLGNIQRAIGATITYWLNQGAPVADAQEDHRNKADALDATWNNNATRAVQRMFLGTHFALGQRDATLRDRAEELVKLMKMMVLAEVLGEVSADIKGDSTVVRTPTLARIGEFRKGLQALRKEFSDRRNEIQNEVSDPNVPVLRVWASGSFEGDLQRVLSQYSRQPKAYPTLSHISDKSAWDLLDGEVKVTAGHQVGQDQVNTGLLFENLKRVYQNTCKDLLGNAVNPVAYAQRNPQDAARVARRALSGLLHLSSDPTCGEPGVPRFLLGSDGPGMRELVTALNTANNHDFTSQHIVQVPLLGDAVFFYEEKSKIEPLRSLSAVSMLKERFENLPPSLQDDAVSNSRIWKQHRLAYGVTASENVERRERRTLAQKMMRFAVQFGLKYQRNVVTRRWTAIGPRWGSLAIVPGDPPTFTYVDDRKIGRILELAADRAVSVRVLAEDSPAFAKLQDQIESVLKENNDASLAIVFNQEIMDRVKDEKSVQEANAFSDEFFGRTVEGEFIPGIIGELRGDALKTGVTHA